ncbi:hypothetical protein EON80_22130 [bacterium]|nr:MAG: hypothetical protein EON80_22130 [bacterium]
MSWNTSAILINSRIGETPEQCFAALGAETGESEGNISFDEASSLSLGGRAIAVVEDWTIIFDPFMFRTLYMDSEGESKGIWPFELENRLQELSTGHEVVSFLIFGTSDTFGFAHFQGGEQSRCFLFQEGAALKQIGTVSAEEELAFAQNPGDEEQAILSLVEKLSVSWDQIAAAEFALFQFDEF